MRAPNGGWDFVRVGQTYQYKEDWFIAMVKVLEDKSDDEYYRFVFEVQKATHEPVFAENGVFEISHVKKLDGVFSGMLQIYPQETYWCKYKWER